MNPNDSIVDFKYAVYPDAVGRPQDAVTHMRRALQLDPLSFLMNRPLDASLHLARITLLRRIPPVMAGVGMLNLID